MDRAGHKERLMFKVMEDVMEKSKQRSRDVLWSSNIRTNVGLQIISNTKKLKVSYRTTSNMSSVIKANTKKILSGMVMDNARKGWNCKGGLAVRSVQGNCLELAVSLHGSIRVYKAEVTTAMAKKHFYGFV